MRQETNNEMDLLLRRLGRRQDTGAPDDHLDADELSSYAENALPPAARARYTEHLAECARCRDLVVQLSSSAGVVVAQETAKVSGPSALRQFLASLFSPMVLRYAVPALGLVVVAAIGFIVSRQQQPRQSSVAQVTQNEQAPVSASAPQPSSSPGAFYDSPETTAPAKRAAQGTSDKETAPAPPPNAAPVVGVTAQVQDAAPKTEQQPVVANEPPAPKPTTETANLQKLEAADTKKKTTDDRAVAANEPPAEKTADESKKDESKKEDRKSADVGAARARTAQSRAEPFGVAAAPQAGAGSKAMVRRDAEESEKDKNDAETRTVAGRRFRKQGNVWIDTAYNSQGTTNYSRGSEAYRALVADEPVIKRIADELGGVIIVVWKGRAYKIQ